LIKKPNENQNLLLNTLKEIIQNSEAISDKILKLVPFLFEFSEQKDESVRNIAAECIGIETLFFFSFGKEGEKIKPKSLYSTQQIKI
jgi:hypothetical protein